VAVIAAALALAAVSALTGDTWSAFSGETSNSGNSLQAQRIFAGTRVTSAWDVRDQGTGTEVDESDAVSFAGDGLVAGTNPLPATYDSTKHIEFAMESSLPSGLAVTGAEIRLDLSRPAGAGSLSFFVALRRLSSGAVLQTYGSPTAPYGTLTGATPQPFTLPAPEIDTTTLANDVAVRIYAWDAANAALGVDRVQVSGSTSYSSFTLQRRSALEAFGVPTDYPYRLVAAEADDRYVTSGSWATTFDANRYLRLTFDPDLPPGATVTGVTLTHAFRALDVAGGPEQCVYYEVRSGATVVGSSFGGITQASPACTFTTFRVDTLDLTGVDTASEVNGLELRIYGTNSKSREAEHDQATLAVTYGLD